MSFNFSFSWRVYRSYEPQRHDPGYRTVPVSPVMTRFLPKKGRNVQFFGLNKLINATTITAEQGHAVFTHVGYSQWKVSKGLINSTPLNFCLGKRKGLAVLVVGYNLLYLPWISFNPPSISPSSRFLPIIGCRFRYCFFCWVTGLGGPDIFLPNNTYYWNC